MGLFPLYLPTSLIRMQPRTKEALPAGSSVLTATTLLVLKKKITSYIAWCASAWCPGGLTNAKPF